MTDLTALQEAEGALKAAREALTQAEARAAEAHAVADASVANAREHVAKAEGHARALLDAEQRMIDARRERLSLPATPTPLRPIGLTEEVFNSAGHGFYAQQGSWPEPRMMFPGNGVLNADDHATARVTLPEDAPA
jgi:endonuclease/exonuclease/phosphatase family metal-dependent hydrolase